MIGLVFLVFAVGGGQLWLQTEKQKTLAQGQAEDARQVALLGEAQSAFGEYRYWQLAQLADNDESGVDRQAETRVRLELAYQHFATALKHSQHLAPEGMAVVLQQVQALEKLRPELTARLSSRDAAANARFGAELRARLDALYDALSATVQRASTQASAQSGQGAGENGLNWFVILGSLSAVMLLLALAIRSLVRPLETLVAGAEDLSRGKLDSPLPLERGDEIGSLAKALDQFREAIRRWDYLAYHDAITGMGNRARLQQLVATEITRSQREGSALTLLYVSLDQYTNISDSIGPAVGDELLRLAARRLAASPPEGAQVFYLGGLHFAVLSNALPNDARLVATSEQMARSLISELSRPFTLQDHEMDMAVNIGIVTCPQDGVSYDELIGNAHAALVHSRKRSNSGFHFYTRSLTEKARSRLALASQLRRAVEFDELQLHYQPILDVAANRILCAEALVRWQHPTRGLIMPGEFIQVAEESGVINAMGEWCLAKASLDTRIWRESGVPPIKLSVNLSARQLNEPGLVDGIQRTLENTGASPSELELEITESAMMLNPERSARVMRHLKSLGITIAMDDFGTGYSSLTYLQRFPLDKIKIDRSFVSRLNRRRKDDLIIAATASLAADLGLSVVAEGVETREQMQALQELGCNVMQGFLFSRGLPLDEFVSWASKRRNAIADASRSN